MVLLDISFQVGSSSLIFLLSFSLYSNIATKSAYKVSGGYIEPLENHDLVGWFWVDMSETSFQVGRSSPIFKFYFSLCFNIYQ